MFTKTMMGPGGSARRSSSMTRLRFAPSDMWMTSCTMRLFLPLSWSPMATTTGLRM
jgi:hypothetical protein